MGFRHAASLGRARIDPGVHVTAVTACRVCRSARLTEILDFGDLPLTGVFPASPDETVSEGRVRLCLCQDCGLVQLGDTFPAEEMYGDNYGYRSGLNNSMVGHLERIARRLEQRVDLRAGDVILDIGANDGTLLRSYSVAGLKRIGIDPTIAKFSEYYPPDITPVADFFSANAFDALSDQRARVVTSIAMFYDLEDPVAFARDIKHCLTDDGIWYFEQSYMPWMLRSGAYDTICHEHLEYYSLQTIKRILNEAGLHLLDAVATGDADDSSPALELLLHGCDRTRFTATRRSPRRPEPQDDVVPFEIVCIDETAADGVLHEVVGPLGGDRGRRTVFDRGRVVGGTCHGEQGDDSRQTREQDPGAVREHE